MMKKFLYQYMYTLIVVGLLAIFVVYNTSIGYSVEDQFQRVTVEAGDSIWDIAKARVGEGQKQADFVNWVAKNNSIDVHQIRPGQEVFIPVKK